MYAYKSQLLGQTTREISIQEGPDTSCKLVITKWKCEMTYWDEMQEISEVGGARIMKQVWKRRRRPAPKLADSYHFPLQLFAPFWRLSPPHD